MFILSLCVAKNRYFCIENLGNVSYYGWTCKTYV